MQSRFRTVLSLAAATAAVLALLAACERSGAREEAPLATAPLTANGYCEGLTLAATLTASSSEGPAFPASAAMDGTQSTRWASAWSDPQWIRLDFGTVKYIRTLGIWWEQASSRNYTLQVSNDGATWTTIRTVTGGAPGAGYVRHYNLDARGRYLRLHSTARNTAYGISILEMEVFGDVPDCSPGLTCGNGVIDIYEVCEDGNNRLLDGCGNSCRGNVAYYRLHNRKSGKVLDIPNGSTSSGARAQQWTWLQGTNQQWNLQPNAFAAEFVMYNVQSGKCLEVAGASMADGAALQQWDCHGGTSQKYFLRYVVDGAQLVSRHSGKCVEVAGAGTADGAKLQQWTCGTGSGGLHQKWDPRLMHP